MTPPDPSLTELAEPDLARHWTLDPKVTYLNHGSFGACPRPVLAVQQGLRERLEHEPMRFFLEDLEGLLDETRRSLGSFLGADPIDLVFVPNATTGANTVLRSLRLEPGDDLLITDHAYNACRNALDYVAGRSGARVVVVSVPFPLVSPDQVVEAVLERVTPRTRLALLDHITSPTGLVLPIERMVQELSARGIDTLVDGAHAAGMVPVDLRSLNPTYYTGNCHKWLCAPKGAAYLYVRKDRQQEIRPLAISHGANSPRSDRPTFLLEFDWVGTLDPTAWLSVPESIRFLGALVPGGWPEVMRRNRTLALEARALLSESLGIPPAAPAEMIGSMVAFPLPEMRDGVTPSHFFYDPLQEALVRRFSIQAPVWSWPEPPQKLIRVSAQLYNRREQYVLLAEALRELLPR